MSTLGSLVVRIVGDNSQFNKTIAQTQKQLNASTKGLQTVARSMTTVGDSMVKGITLPLVAIGVVSVKMAKDFEVSMRNVNSISKLSEEELKSLSKQVIALSTDEKMGAQSAKNLAEGLYDISSSGFQGKEGLKVLTASAKAAGAGLTTTAVSAKGVTAVLNAFGYSADMAGEVADTMFRTVDKGVITFEELSSTVGDWVGMAKAANISFNEASGAIAYMTTKGISATEAGTSLQRMLVGIIKPSKDMAAVIKEAGFESGEMMLKQLGLTGTMKILNDVTGGSITKLIDLIPEIRGVRGANALLGAGYEELTGYMNDFKDTSGAMDAALEEQSKSLQYQFNILKNNATAIGIEIGNVIIPKLKDALGSITPKVKELTKWFGNLTPAMQDNLIKWGLIAAALPLVISGIGRATTGIIKFRNALMTMNAGLASFAVGGSGMAAILTGLVAGLSRFGAQGIPALGLFIDQTGMLKSAVGELNHIVHEMTGVKFQNWFWIPGKEGEAANKEIMDMTSNIQDLAMTISTQSPETQAKAMELFMAYKNGTVILKELEKGMADISWQYRENAPAVDKAKQSVDDYKQTLIDQGYTEKEATEQARVHAETMGYVADEEGNLEEATDDTTDAIDDQTEAINAAKKALDELYDSLFNNYLLNADIAEGLKEATKRYEEYTKAVNEHGAGSDEAIEKEEEWIRTLDMLTSTKIPDLINKTGELTEEEIGHLQVMKDQIEKAHELGIVSDEEWNNISRNINDKIRNSIIPDYKEMYRQGHLISEQKIEPEIDVDTSQAMEKLKRLREALEAIGSARVTSSYAFSTVGGALGGIFTGKEFLRPGLSAAGGMVIPKFDSGGVLAMLHPPEIVLNEKQAMRAMWNQANKPIDTKSDDNLNQGQPIQITNVIELDGQIIGKKTSEYLYNGTKTKQIGMGF